MMILSSVILSLLPIGYAISTANAQQATYYFTDQYWTNRSGIFANYSETISDYEWTFGDNGTGDSVMLVKKDLVATGNTTTTSKVSTTKIKRQEKESMKMFVLPVK